MDGMSGVARELSERARLWQLVCGIWVSFANSASWSIGAFENPVLKAAPNNFSQHDLNLLGAISGVIVNLGAVPCGALYDRFGPQWCLRVGAVCMFVGLLLKTMMYCGLVSVQWWLLLVASSISGQCNSLYESGSFVANIALFSKDKGSVLMVEEGLGGAIAAVWYNSFMGHDLSTTLIVATVLLPLAGAGASLVIRRPTLPEIAMPWHGHRRFIPAYLVIGTSLLFFTAIDLTQNFISLSVATHMGLGSVGVVTFAAYALLPLVNSQPYLRESPESTSLSFVPPPAPPTSWASGASTRRRTYWSLASFAPKHATASGTPKAAEAAPLLVNSSSFADTSPANDAASAAAPPQGPSYGEALRRPDIYLLAVASIAQWGVSDMILDNSSQIYQSLNGGVLDKNRNAVYVSVASVFAAVGRIAVSLLDMRTADKTSLLVVAPCVVLAGCICILIFPVEGLVAGLALVSMGNSWTWSSRVLVAKQLFSGPSFGKLWNTLYLFSLWTPWAFNVGLFATLYDATAAQLRTAPNCPRRACIETSVAVGAVVCVVSVSAAAVLHIRSRRAFAFPSSVN